MAELTTEQLINLLLDGQFEVSGLRPDRRIRPAIVAYNATLAANGTPTITFDIGGASPFICTEIRGWFTGAATMNLKPSTYQEGLAKGGIHTSALFGPAASPRSFSLARPWLLDPRTTMTLDLADLSASSNPFGIVLAGFRSDV